MDPAHCAPIGKEPSLRTIDAQASALNLLRQNLVWLDVSKVSTEVPTEASKIVVGREEDRQLAIDWVYEDRPFVVRRDEERHPVGTHDQIALGLPLPTRLQRRRIALRVPAVMITRVEKMPHLAEAIDVAFVHWRKPLRDLADQLAECGAMVRVYGSLSWQYMTGETYLHAASDVDLLIEPHPGSDISALLGVLSQTVASVEPLLDGEIVLAPGQAVAWRELLNQTPDVMVRRLDGVFLMPRETALAMLLSGNPT